MGRGVEGLGFKVCLLSHTAWRRTPEPHKALHRALPALRRATEGRSEHARLLARDPVCLLPRKALHHTHHTSSAGSCREHHWSLTPHLLPPRKALRRALPAQLRGCRRERVAGSSLPPPYMCLRLLSRKTVRRAGNARRAERRR